MLYADGLFGLVILVVWVYSLFDVITSDSGAVRNLPKLAWFVIVLLLGELAIGPALWRFAGRPYQPGSRSAGSSPSGPASGSKPEPDRPQRAPAPHPDDDAAFLFSLHTRAEEQRKRAAEQAQRLRDAENNRDAEDGPGSS